MGRGLRIGYPNPGTYSLNGEYGSYALTGGDASLIHVPANQYVLTSEQGSYTLAGQGVVLTASSNSHVSGSIQISVSGSDSNNGIPVGETGGAGYLNGVAGTGPFRTFDKVLQLCAAGSIAKPCIIYPRADMTHEVTNLRFLNMGGSNTTITAEKVIFKNFPGEEWTLDTFTAGHPHESSTGYGPISVRSRNWGFEGANFMGAYALFFGGTGSGGPCAGSYVKRCRQTTAYLANGGFIENHGIITGQNSNCSDLLIEECDFIGSLITNANYGTLCWDRPGANVHVLNCRITNSASANYPLHHKYNSIRALDELLYENCMLARGAGVAGSIWKGADGQSYTTFRNNIWWVTDNSSWFNTWGITGANSEGPLGYRVRLYNNGFYRSGSTAVQGIWIVDNAQTATDGEEAAIFQNEFMGRVRFSDSGGSNAYTENSTGDENVFGLGNGSNTHTRGTSHISLAAWQSHKSGAGSGLDDANSVDEAVVFADPGNQDIDDPTTFERDASSPLFGTAGPNISTWRRWSGAGEGAW